MMIPDQRLHLQSKDEWRVWLQENHASEKEAWLVIRKTNTAKPGVSYEEAVEEALCFGWIDGIMTSIDAEHYRLRFSPRKRGSIWSVSNQRRVERLSAEGRMAETGLAKVREAQDNGEWEAAIRREDVSSLPEDLRVALGGNASAQANFDGLSPSQKRQFLYWIASAKTEKTRQRRIEKTVEMAANRK
jgi:uncharacterized protein YdeI (YjbR/CyaY-like superfamily)